jgi:lipopolysaccharide transport system permease protein
VQVSKLSSNIETSLKNRIAQSTATIETTSDTQASNTIADTLPEQPLVRIARGKSGSALRVRDVWAYRELLFFLTWRDVKVRYKQTSLGAAWAILQPLLTMLTFTLLFGKLAGIHSGDIPYPLFSYAGLLIWTFFANAITNSGNSLVSSANLITKVYFPRLIIPAAAVIAGLVDLGIALIVLVPLMIYYQVRVGFGLVMIPLLVLICALLALGIGMWLSALNVKYRDIRYAIPFLIQLWMFASPVIYPASLLPEKWRWILLLNPLTGIIVNFRIALFGGQSFEWNSLGVSAVVTIFILFYSAYSFRRMERHFADIV